MGRLDDIEIIKNVLVRADDKIKLSILSIIRYF